MRPHRDTVNIKDAHRSISTGVISHTAHFHDAADVGEEQSLLRDLTEGRRSSYRLLKAFTRPDGSQVWGDLTVSAVRDDEGGLTCFIAQVIDVTDQVPEEFRVALVLRDVMDLDYEQIAEILGVPGGTVRSRIARGRARLAELLGNQYPGSERHNPDE